MSRSISGYSILGSMFASTYSSYFIHLILGCQVFMYCRIGIAYLIVVLLLQVLYRWVWAIMVTWCYSFPQMCWKRQGYIGIIYRLIYLFDTQTSDIYSFLFIFVNLSSSSSQMLLWSVHFSFHIDIICQFRYLCIFICQFRFMYFESFDTRCQFRDLCIMGSFRW